MNMEHFFPNKEQFDTMNRILCAIASNGGGITVNSWRDVQSIVRLGLADKVFSIGDQLVCNKGDEQLVWDVIGFDHDVPANKLYTHSMTLQLHDTLPTAMQFDGTEALFYCETELAAGTYNFTILAGYDTTYGGGTTYQFTLTKAIPAGGVIMFPWDYLKQASTILVSTYESRTATTAIESVSVTEGTDGTPLETLGECNHIHRIRYGSNNWKQSAIRQFLNSKGAAETFWTPQTNFDRPPTWNASTAGFLSDLDEDFLEVVGEVTKRTVLNTICDGGGYEDLTEKFFLISRSEACPMKENNIEEGSCYTYYLDCEDSDRIKRRLGAAIIWWMRTPNANEGDRTRVIIESGKVHGYSANYQFYVSPVCNII